MMDKMDCLHVYMLYNGKLITEAHLYDLAHYSVGVYSDQSKLQGGDED